MCYLRRERTSFIIYFTNCTAFFKHLSKKIKESVKTLRYIYKKKILILHDAMEVGVKIDKVVKVKKKKEVY